MSYIFRAGSNLVSSSIKKIRKKKKEPTLGFFFIRSPIGSRVCLTICTASHKSVKFYIFAFQVFDSVKIQLNWLDKTWCLCFLDLKTQMSNTRREILFCVRYSKMRTRRWTTHFEWVWCVHVDGLLPYANLPRAYIKANLIITWI